MRVFYIGEILNFHNSYLNSFETHFTMITKLKKWQKQQYARRNMLVISLKVGVFEVVTPNRPRMLIL